MGDVKLPCSNRDSHCWSCLLHWPSCRFSLYWRSPVTKQLFRSPAARTPSAPFRTYTWPRSASGQIARPMPRALAGQICVRSEPRFGSMCRPYRPKDTMRSQSSMARTAPVSSPRQTPLAARRPRMLAAPLPSTKMVRSRATSATPATDVGRGSPSIDAQQRIAGAGLVGWAG